MLSKIIFAATIALSANAETKAECKFKNEENKCVGRVNFHQETENDDVSMSSFMKDLDGSRYSIDHYMGDPSEGASAHHSLGEFRPNRRDKMFFSGMYTQNLTLNGDSSLAGDYLGVTCKETGTLISSCEIKIKE